MRQVGWICAVCVLKLNLFAQTSTRDVILNSNIQAFASKTPVEVSPTIAENEDLTLNNIRDYKYVLNREEGKAYKRYQAVKLDGLTSQDIIVGLVTHTLERENRYIEIGAGRIALLKQILDESDVDYVFVSPFEKEYFIAGDGTYRYIDGRELVGTKKVRTYLEKGKPVTVSTFYFALKDKGLIRKEMTLRTFMSMTVEEHISMLGLSLYASSR